MSKGKILVTDTLFIFDEHVKKLEDAGYEVARLEKPNASEDELCEAIKDKVGYILGGVEYATDRVFVESDKLKAIVFTGTGFKGHISGWQTAMRKGIHIGNTPYANVYEVSEWALAATLAMQRDLFELGPQGSAKFHTITSLPDLRVGVLGLGHIGEKYAEMIDSIGAKEVVYWSRSPKKSKYKYVEKDALFSECDIIFVAVGDDAGQDFIGSDEFRRMKQDALLVSIAHHGIINEDQLYDFVSSGKIRAALDIVKNHEKFKDLSLSGWYASNSSAAYNSIGFLQRASDMAIDTLINLLETGDAKNKVRA